MTELSWLANPTFCRWCRRCRGDHDYETSFIFAALMLVIVAPVQDLEIPGSMLSHRPGMTAWLEFGTHSLPSLRAQAKQSRISPRKQFGLLRRGAPRNDDSLRRRFTKALGIRFRAEGHQPAGRDERSSPRGARAAPGAELRRLPAEIGHPRAIRLSAGRHASAGDLP